MKPSAIMIIIACFFLACTPKIKETTSAVPAAAPIANKVVGPCGKFSESPDQETAMNAHVIYRDYLRNENYREAFPLWKVAYQLAPAADGKRNTHYADGIRFYENFYAKATDEAKKESYVDTIFMLYDRIEECYGEKGYVAGLKAFDLYYKYKNRASQDEIFNLFQKSIEIDGDSANFFILNPFTDLLVRRYFDQKISLNQAQRYDAFVRERLSQGLSSGDNKEQWQIINEYVPQRLEAFEGVKGFYDCNYYKEKYWSAFEADSTNCDVIGEVYGKLRWGGCDTASAELVTLLKQGKKHCISETAPSESKLAYNALREGNYEEAIELFKEAVSATDDSDKKANYLLLISKIYYRDLKNFPQSRKFALEAANFKANWGEPYLLIGRLYASSGPLCGPGRGWDSQIVVWPAIDKWNYAKRIDPDAAAEANRMINTYAQYMPDKEDIFQRTLKEGQSFRVGCWIQETTTIRPARN
ncbi:MAG: tetratricopeptide repeat protein [Saprospiraceae bacterium]|nr:tetratricopeptide repeat protein [Saprospiraceae bacterium]